MSLRDNIFALDDIPKETIEVPEWGCWVQVRGITGGDRAYLTEQATDGNGDLKLETIYPDLVILATYDTETAERVFRESDRDALMSKSSKALDRIALVALRLAGFTDSAVDDAGKGSTSTLSDASSSVSPGTSAEPAPNFSMDLRPIDPSLPLN